MDSNTERDSQLKSDWEAGVGAGVGGGGASRPGQHLLTYKAPGAAEEGGAPPPAGCDLLCGGFTR